MTSKLFKNFIRKAILSKQGPPGPAPREGLQWKPQTHRWIRPKTDRDSDLEEFNPRSDDANEFVSNFVSDSDLNEALGEDGELEGEFENAKELGEYLAGNVSDELNYIRSDEGHEGEGYFEETVGFKPTKQNIDDFNDAVKVQAEKWGNVIWDNLYGDPEPPPSPGAESQNERQTREHFERAVVYDPTDSAEAKAVDSILNTFMSGNVHTKNFHTEDNSPEVGKVMAINHAEELVARFLNVKDRKGYFKRSYGELDEDAPSDGPLRQRISDWIDSLPPFKPNQKRHEYIKEHQKKDRPNVGTLEGSRESAKDYKTRIKAHRDKIDQRASSDPEQKPIVWN